MTKIYAGKKRHHADAVKVPMVGQRLDVTSSSSMCLLCQHDNLSFFELRSYVNTPTATWRTVLGRDGIIVGRPTTMTTLPPGACSLGSGAFMPTDGASVAVTDNLVRIALPKWYRG